MEGTYSKMELTLIHIPFLGISLIDTDSYTNYYDEISVYCAIVDTTC